MPVLRLLPRLALLLACCLPPAVAGAPGAEIELELDAREAARGLQSARLLLPVEPGPLTLLYPKWIPGNHRPSGPANALSGIEFRADGQVLAWQRDPLDMWAFRLEVPAGARMLEARLELLGVPGAQAPSAERRASDALASLQWNRVLLYPAGTPAAELRYRARLRLPAGWRQASALPVESEAGDAVRYAPVSLETLVDSPVLAGRHLRSFPLGGEPAVQLHAAADSAAALALRAPTEQALRRLVTESRALFGPPPYRQYHFLLALSDQGDAYGLEHHESSDNWVGERALVDDDAFRAMATLLPHEYVHSWNGKFRRPAALATQTFHEPVQPDLLWVYEGLTEYLQYVLTARSGLLPPEEVREDWAYAAAEMALRRGRAWRPLQDTARAVQLTRGQPQDWVSRRRGVDYYTEGALLWLEADALIRARSKGRRSLDDFCRAFLGAEGGAPRVAPYDFADVVAALEAVQPHDWTGFWRDRLDRVRSEPPLEGLAAAGWRLGWAGEPTAMQRAYDAVGKRLDLRHSLGFALGTADSLVTDVVPGSPAERAGMAPGSVLLAVDGRKWSEALLGDALAASAAGEQRIELLVQDTDRFRTHALAYAGGARYPRLERIEGTRDWLSEIGRPRQRP